MEQFKITDTAYLQEKPRNKALNTVAAVRLAKQIKAEERLPTEEEKQTLAKFNGFVIPAIFNLSDRPNWGEEARAELQELLTEKEFQAAQASVLNAYYTSPEIIQAIWGGMKKLGFKGGKAIEPGSGINLFIGLQPESLRSKTNWTTVELEPTTAAIASLLYPEVTSFNRGFQETSLPNNYYDLAIGNVPFGDYKIADEGYPNTRIHNYFICKAINLVAPGRIVCLITSTGTLDSEGNLSIRQWMAERAKLLGAIRLPSSAFEENAGTEVTTDILIFQKLAPGIEPNPEEWATEDYTSFEFDSYDQDYDLNTEVLFANQCFEEGGIGYFLGTPTRSKLYGGTKLGLSADNRDIESAIDDCFEAIATRYTPVATRTKTVQAVPLELQDLENHSYCFWQGKLYKRQPDQIVLIKKEQERIKAAICLHDVLSYLIRFQQQNVSDSALGSTRADLNQQYDSFVDKWGKFHDRENQAIFDKCPQFQLLLALEIHPPKTHNFKKMSGYIKADIFTKRTAAGYHPPKPGQVDRVEDALNHSLNSKGFIDIPWISLLMGITTSDAIALFQEGEKPLIYFDPALNRWDLAESYLSGNVRSKLQLARHHELSANIAALEAIQPLHLLPPGTTEIKAEVTARIGIESVNPDPEQTFTCQLGARWIPQSVIESFLTELLGSKTVVEYISSGSLISTWTCEFFSSTGRNLTTNKTVYGTNAFEGIELAQYGLNMKDPVVYDLVDKKRVINPVETELARAKLQEIKEEFQSWLWKDVDRAEHLTRLYNDIYNNSVERVYDGSHITLPGINPNFNPRSHQKRGVWRIAQNKATALAWVVGSGKAQPLNAKILTPTGWTRMGKLKIGDKIISVDGKLTTVMGVYPQGLKDIYKVSFSDKSSTECCEEHLWLTQTYQERNRANKAKSRGKIWESANPKVRTLKEISQTLISPHLGAKNHSIPVVQPVQFEPQPIDLDSYLLGVLLGDGNISQDVCRITSNDPEIFEECAKLLPPNTELRLNKDHKKCLTYGISIIKKEGFGANIKPNPVTKTLREFGLMGTTSGTKFIPDAYKFNSVEVRIALLQGLIDTDGEVTPKGSVCFSTASKKLREDVTFLVQSLGGTASKGQKIPSYTHNGEKRAGNVSYTLCIKLPPDIIPCRLKRKLDLVIPKTKYKPIRYITNVEYVGKKQAQCIMVDHPSHLYVTDDFIVTHNTAAMAIAAMELRRLGLAFKPVLVVLNSTVKQIEAEFRHIYPHAKLLVPTPKSFTAEHIGQFLNQIATGSWDCCIVSHEQFYSMRVSKELELSFLEEQQAQLEELAEENEDYTTTKILERAKRTLENRIDKVLNDKRKKDGVDFEQLNIDAIFVDESHYFKNLGYTTAMNNIAGLPNSHSQRAQDMFIKTQLLLNAGKRVVFCSGTPISNSMAECYTVSRYLQTQTLEECGVQHFDAWASQFGEVVTKRELTGYGKYKQKTRFRRFVNWSQLMAMYRQVVDIVTAEELNIPIPKVNYIPVDVASSPSQSEYMDELASRAQLIQNKVVPPDEDNMLVVTSDGRKACLDLRLVDSTAENFKGGKVNACILNLWRIWKATQTFKAIQLVFCDFSTPKENPNIFDVYNYIKDMLVGLGIPAHEIAFVHQAKNASDRQQLFNAVKTGEIRILLGSTQKLGTGVNVQDLAIAIHDLDAPWRPSDIEQREGRARRYGNRWQEIFCFRYVTKGDNSQCGFDSYLWQNLETKARFIAPAFTNSKNISTMEESNDFIVTAAALKAIASGNPLIERREELEELVSTMALRRRGHNNQQFGIKISIQRYEAQIKNLPIQITNLEKDLETVQQHPHAGKHFSLRLDQDNVEISDKEVAKKALQRYRGQKPSSEQTKIGSYAGFALCLTPRQRFILQSPTQQTYFIGECFDQHLIEKLERISSTISWRIDETADDLRHAHQTLSDLKEQDGLPFKDEATYLTLRAEKEDIESILFAEESKSDELSANDEASENSETEGDQGETEAAHELLATGISTSVYYGAEIKVILDIRLKDQEEPDWLTQIKAMSPCQITESGYVEIKTKKAKSSATVTTTPQNQSVAIAFSGEYTAFKGLIPGTKPLIIKLPQPIRDGLKARTSKGLIELSQTEIASYLKQPRF